MRAYWLAAADFFGQAATDRILTPRHTPCAENEKHGWNQTPHIRKKILAKPGPTTFSSSHFVDTLKVASSLMRPPRSAGRGDGRQPLRERSPVTLLTASLAATRRDIARRIRPRRIGTGQHLSLGSLTNGGRGRCGKWTPHSFATAHRRLRRAKHIGRDWNSMRAESSTTEAWMRASTKASQLYFCARWTCCNEGGRPRRSAGELVRATGTLQRPLP
jgi:hypothetical protein